jgi:hypothetical protein
MAFLKLAHFSGIVPWPLVTVEMKQQKCMSLWPALHSGADPLQPVASLIAPV